MSTSRAPAATGDVTRLSIDVFKALAVFGTATLHEAAGRIGALPSAIKPVHSGMRVCGPAVTVRSPPGDNLWIHRAIYAATPGDVLLVSTGGEFEYGYWGEIMSHAAATRKLGGLVIDGCVRDHMEIGKIDFPVFARGLCIRGTGKDFGALGWIGAPILVEDVRVQPGDAVIGDADGVVVLPATRAADTAAAAEAREAREREILDRLRGGERSLDIYGLS